MFKKILIANRGEIALRVIRACREMGISTVAVYSEADRDSLHVRFADEIVCIGPPRPNESYLNVPRIISAAEITGADGIHPGYGFLAENGDFAEACESCGIKFIGPSPSVIKQMGDKASARQAMLKAKVPVVPGSQGVVSEFEDAVEIAHEIGYPVMIKASGGGGGKGMRLAMVDDELKKAFEAAANEADASFGNREVYLEKFIERPRHIEIQVLCDSRGEGVYLGERDCSVQRKHQKLIEESPSPAVNEEIRAGLGEAAISGALAVGYESAGTVEFLMDCHGSFYFIEMNTRVQVEHCVTEMVTGTDIVQEQIRIAAGEPMTIKQEDVVIRGHAIECRINAEDPERNFAPSPGRIDTFHMPGGTGIRVDSHAYAQYMIPPYYDSLIAKLVAHAPDRDQAIARVAGALDEFIVEGVKTTIPFHQQAIRSKLFRSGKFDTHFVEELAKGEEGAEGEEPAEGGSE
ncbi:acetyl-CoA carboxylase biotin carboxylase subunit [Candidatus Eisenbacteria bacterium]|uniref:Biotin carboxylase n=1 Tax=Eiseniibacteriota bacterium TaxID=2212470 RepID=A0ABV6YQ57_UNCEI